MRHRFASLENAHVAVTLTIAFEMWSTSRIEPQYKIGATLPPELVRSGQVDLSSASWLRYGPTVGLPRTLRQLEELEVPATLLVNGRAAEEYPDPIGAFAEAGHEIAAHGWTQDPRAPGLSDSEERDRMVQCIDLLEKCAGERPVGWISPGAQPSARTAGLLTEHGFIWHADAADSDLPYVQTVGDKRIVALPYQPEINDLSFIRFRTPPSDLVALFANTLSFLLEEPRARLPYLLNATIHAPLFTRPFAGNFFRDVLATVGEAAERVAVVTRRDMADMVLHV